MFVRLESGTLINVDRINHMEPNKQGDSDRPNATVGMCWFYKGVGERLTRDDWDRVVKAIERGPGLL